MKDSDYMRMALELAKRGQGWTAPNPMVGAVIVKSGRVIGQGYHRRCGGLHAEREALACCGESPEGATLYVTLEPCPMCAGAVIMSRISSVYYGAREEQTGSCGSVINLFMENYGQSTKVYGGICENECRELMRVFFKNLRRE